jgi:hypothetical protein
MRTEQSQKSKVKSQKSVPSGMTCATALDYGKAHSRNYSYIRKPQHRHFAHLVMIARGEAQEMCGHVASAHLRNCISKDERRDLNDRYMEVAKMLSGLARALDPRRSKVSSVAEWHSRLSTLDS